MDLCWLDALALWSQAWKLNCSRGPLPQATSDRSTKDEIFFSWQIHCLKSMPLELARNRQKSSTHQHLIGLQQMVHVGS